MKTNTRIFAFLIIALMVVSLNYSAAEAAVIGRWSPDARVPGYLDDTFTPFLVADRNRTVHAFASQWVEQQGRRLAVVYRRWSLSGGWTKPVDIILAPTGDAQILGVFLDSSDRVHILFMVSEGLSTAVYYSSTPVANADLAASWSVPVMVGFALASSSAAIIGDDQDNLLIVYSGTRDGSGVYFATSADAGATWSESAPIFLTYDAELVPFNLRLVMGPDRQVRAAWSVVTSLGQDELLYFANYSLPSAKWNLPVELDSRIDALDYFGPSFPAMVDNGNDIVIMYNSGNPFPGRPVQMGRPIQLVRVSSDGGETWNGPTGPFPYQTGRSGEHALVLDSNGVPHALFTQRIELTGDEGKSLTIGGIWHSALQGQIWTNPERIVTTYSPHDVRAVVSQGNVLLAVWREDPGAKHQHGIWFSYALLNSPELPVVIPATAELNTSAPVSTPVPTLYSVPQTATPMINLGSAPSGIVSSPAGPLIISIALVILILVRVLVHQISRDRSR